MKYRAALYIRLSREDENEGPSESIANQCSLLDAYVQQHGISVYDTYVDDGWSGTNFDRPGFRRMIADIVNMVITKDLSRLGRDYIMTGHYMERYFPEKGVRYISLLDGIDTGVESTANDITPFRAIMNDMYAKDISKKIRSVKRDKQRKGEFIGGKPSHREKQDRDRRRRGTHGAAHLQHGACRRELPGDRGKTQRGRRSDAGGLRGLEPETAGRLRGEMVGRADLGHAAKRDVYRQYGAGEDGEGKL